MQPSWSPDGRYVAVTKTSTLGTDVAILDARTGNEVLRLTNDGQLLGAGLVAEGRLDRLHAHRRA